MTNASLMMSAAADLCESSLADLKKGYLFSFTLFRFLEMQKKIAKVFYGSACQSQRTLAFNRLAKKKNLHPASLLHLLERHQKFIGSFITLFCSQDCCHFPDIRYCKLHKHEAWEINKLIGELEKGWGARKLNFAFKVVLGKKLNARLWKLIVRHSGIIKNTDFNKR